MIEMSSPSLCLLWWSLRLRRSLWRCTWREDAKASVHAFIDHQWPLKSLFKPMIYFLNPLKSFKVL